MNDFDWVMEKLKAISDNPLIGEDLEWISQHVAEFLEKGIDKNDVFRFFSVSEEVNSLIKEDVALRIKRTVINKYPNAFPKKGQPYT